MLEMDILSVKILKVKICRRNELSLYCNQKTTILSHFKNIFCEPEMGSYFLCTFILPVTIEILCGTLPHMIKMLL